MYFSLSTTDKRNAFHVDKVHKDFVHQNTFIVDGRIFWTHYQGQGGTLSSYCYCAAERWKWKGIIKASGCSPIWFLPIPAEKLAIFQARFPDEVMKINFS